MSQEGLPTSIAILFAGAILGVSLVAAAIMVAVLFAPGA